MKPETWGIVIGGAIPAFCFALSSILQKVGTNAGIGLGPFLVATGLAIIAFGGVAWVFYPDRAVTVTGVWASFSMGVAWAMGISCVTIGLSRFAVPLSKLVPLYNTNTLLAILFSMVIFAEWQQVNALKLLAGAVLIIVGSILAAGS